MRRFSVALSVASVSMAIAACTSEPDSTGPRSITAGSDLAATVLPASCDKNAISQTAGRYFDSRDAVFGLINTMKSALNTSTTKATGPGFAVLARTADVRRTGIQTGTNVQGAAFVNAVLGCMDVGTIPTSFDATKSLGNGIFEVRSGGTGTFTVAYTALTARTTTAVSPEFGAEPASPSSGPIWPSASGMGQVSQYLVYGYPLGTNNDVVADGFEIGTVPAPNATSGPSVDIEGNPLAIGVCVHSTVVGTDGTETAQLLFHDDKEFLNLQKLGFCSQSITVNSPTNWLRALPNRLFALVTPKTLFAQDETRDFIGGLPSGWSPNKIVGFVNTNYALSFYQQPVNANLRQDIETVIVEATTGASATPPMNVRLTIFNNSGAPSFLTTSKNGDAVSFIDAPLVPTVVDGTTRYLATFSVGFTKAGGYLLNAVGYIGGGNVPTPVSVSNLFNVKNK